MSSLPAALGHLSDTPDRSLSSMRLSVSALIGIGIPLGLSTAALWLWLFRAISPVPM
jgi:hypothetical protein